MSSPSDAAAPLRVTIAWPYLSWGGAQTYLAGCCRHLPPAADVIAVVPRGSDEVLLAYLRERGIGVVEGGEPLDVSPPRSLAHRVRRRATDAMARRGMRLAIEATRPDIVHLDLTPWVSTLTLLRLSRRRPVFCTLHTPLDGHRLRGSWRRRARFLATRDHVHFLAANDGAAHFYGRWLGNGTPLTMIESGVDRTELDAVRRERVDGLVVGAGQLIDRKGVDVLLASIVALTEEHPQLHVRWYGDGPLRDDLARRIGELGAADRIEVHPPHRERADHLAAVASAAVYVQPSREDGLPQAILEAMALGVPVVATDVGSVAGVVVDGTTGRLIAPGDAQQLMAALGELLAAPDDAEQLGRAGQAAVLTRFDAAEAAAAHLARYRAAIRAHPRGGRA